MKLQTTLTASAFLMLMLVVAGPAAADEPIVELGGRCNGYADNNCTYCSYYYGTRDHQGMCGHGYTGYWYAHCSYYANDQCVVG